MNALAAPARRSLQEWLEWQQGLHPRAIDLGLERVRAVAQRLRLLPFPACCITVAGTNGKGSCALLASHLLAGQSRVGVYTSPYLLRYNERVRIDGHDASDADLCSAFEAVESARGETSLTYFEFGTLAALWLFKRANVDYAVLEVGMGGRLDAVNIVDAQAAIVTSIGLDHTDWLGHDREAIGREKAGILRSGQIAVCAERNPPASVLSAASDLGVLLYRIGADFDIDARALDPAGHRAWRWRDWRGADSLLPECPHLLPDNVAAVLALLTAMQRLPDAATLADVLPAFKVTGRRQVIDGDVPMVLDVAHNLEAMQTLVYWLQAHPISGQEHIVLGMLENKPVETIGPLLAGVGRLYVGGLEDVARGLSGADLKARLNAPAHCSPTVLQALSAARAQTKTGDRIVVCGSFHTLAAVLAAEPALAR